MSGTLELIVSFNSTILKKDIEKYSSIIDSLNYLIYQTYYNIIYTVSILSRFLTNPFPVYIKVVKRIFQYLKDIKYLNIVYRNNIDNNEIMKLYNYFDSDFTGNLYQYKSHSGSVFKLAGRVVSTISKYQSIIV